jgi:hypothetical protein
MQRLEGCDELLAALVCLSFRPDAFSVQRQTRVAVAIWGMHAIKGGGTHWPTDVIKPAQQTSAQGALCKCEFADSM